MNEQNNDNMIKNLNELVQKVDNMKKQDKMDLSSDQDLTIAIMNLISIEEHMYFSGAKTGDGKYFDLLEEVRVMRGELLRKIVKNPQGEEWCISKHLLAASMRLIEVGTKQQKLERKDVALDLFKKAYDLYSLFWGINMGAISTENIKKIDDEALNKHDEEKIVLSADKQGFMGKLGALVKKAIDCCIE